MRSELKLNFAEFNRGMKRLAKRFPKRAIIGLGKAGVQLMYDTIFELPSTPLLDSPLRGSGSVFVNNVLVEVSRFGFPDYVTVVCDMPKKPGEQKAIIVFNAPYAAQWHENLPKKGRFTEPTAGIHYMSSKMLANNKKYYDIIAESLRKGY